MCSILPDSSNTMRKVSALGYPETESETGLQKSYLCALPVPKAAGLGTVGNLGVAPARSTAAQKVNHSVDYRPRREWRSGQFASDYICRLSGTFRTIILVSKLRGCF